MHDKTHMMGIPEPLKVGLLPLLHSEPDHQPETRRHDPPRQAVTRRPKRSAWASPISCISRRLTLGPSRSWR